MKPWKKVWQLWRLQHCWQEYLQVVVTAILMKQQVQATLLNLGLLPLIPAQALPMVRQ